MMNIFMEIDFYKGLVPAVIQDESTSEILMVGYMNRESLEKTLETGLVTFYSRKRKKLWVKGETSGNFIKLKDIYLDCDKDCILIKGNPMGPVCHTGERTCFFTKI